MKSQEDANLYENEVVEAVKNWIKSEHPDWIIWRAWHFDVVAGPFENEPAVAVECKGHPSERYKVHRAIGQCLDYTTFTKVPCFIAIPQDFIYNNRILKTLEHHKLPIGLLVVDDDGNVKILRTGKELHIKE